MITTRRDLLQGFGAALIAPHVYALRTAEAERSRDEWASWLPIYLRAQIEAGERKYRSAAGYSQYMHTSQALLHSAERYGDQLEPLRSATAAPLQWISELKLSKDDARVLAQVMRPWAGIGPRAYARQLCPYSAAQILVEHEIAWTELEDHPSLIWQSMQAERRRLLPVVSKRMSERMGQSLSLRWVGVKRMRYYGSDRGYVPLTQDKSRRPVAVRRWLSTSALPSESR